MSDIPLQKSQAEGIGQKLRARRKALGIPMREVADGAGLSIGFISQVERGISEPSLTSLRAILKVLGASVQDVLPDLPAAPEATRSTDRRRYQLRPGVAEVHSFERISTTFPGSVLTSVIIHEPPGSRLEPQSHDGEEMFFILEGSLTVELEGQATVLNRGDTLHFSSRRLHSTWNHTSQTASMLHVCTTDVFGDQIPDEDSLPGAYVGHEDSAPAPKTSKKK